MKCIGYRQHQDSQTQLSTLAITRDIIIARGVKMQMKIKMHY